MPQKRGTRLLHTHEKRIPPSHHGRATDLQTTFRARNELDPDHLRSYLVTVVAPKDVPVVIESVATLDGLVNATITPRVSGHIISQDYKEGSAVKKGDLLFQIDPRPFEQALAQAKANLAKAQATQAKADADEKRALELFIKQVTSAQERDTALQAAGAAKGDTEADQ